ncbi:MAG: hypothetical protein OEV85_08625 [Candidatus Thorarchaeota archaeon]|nr:hypothetical protein [Candidatus Thorarchaeota archaeon]
MKNASVRIILDDLKVSFKFALKNVISYILALFGVLIISGILLVFVAILIFVPLFFGVGIEGLIFFFESVVADPSTGFANILVGGLAIALPLAAPFFVAIGALFGMGREIVESEGTSAEGVFTWYKKKFFSLAGGGLVLFLVVLGPLILVILGGVAVFGIDFFNFALISSGTASTMNPIIGAVLMIWFAVSLGLLSMLFPAIIDGYSVFGATKKSIRLSITYFDRVFGVWMAYLLILGALILPFIVTAFTMSSFEPALILLGSMAVPAILFLIFIFMPALTIGLTRVYMILTADDEYEEHPQEDTSGPNFIGGL